ncbi:unnamed protein product [Darwinula stevensoni]|uniref:Uncharacterized protein n=1 Tax=Darwinula stevensoni TaxID=69355 RepID=A0A7R8X3B5_9CRUS|nr:unnamed protein product [Darwinula stevensoni]CAG0878537.1 unnamed protein product [Darwinula stevensoni]
MNVRMFFKEFGIRELHAAAVVVPAPTSRLSPAENYVFNCIRQLFGKDVRDNIYLLLTFSDCERGPAADTVKEAGIPFVKHFQVNNSVLYADRAKADPLAETYWNISVEGYEGFLDEVFRVKPVSLELTKVIMEERQAWEEQFHQLHLQLDRSFKELAKFREDCKSSEPDPPGLDEKLKKLKEEIRKVMTDVDHHHAQLQGKSLNSHQMTSMDYISLMINTEVQERKPGHQDRLKLLKAVKVEDPTNSQKPEEKDQEKVLDNSKPNQGSPAEFSRLHRFWRSLPIGSGRKNQQNKVTQPQDSSILDGEYSDAPDTPAQEGMQHDAGLHRGGLWRSLRRTLSGWGKRRHENRHSKTIPEEGQGQEVKEQKQEKESDVPSAEMPEAPSDRPVAQPEKSEPRTGKHNCIIL